MKRGLLIVASCFALAGCAAVQSGLFGQPESVSEPPAPDVRKGSGQTHPRARPVDADEAAGAPGTADATESGAGGAFLGVTVASLGAVGEPGAWLKTPLVDTSVKGRVELAVTGTAAAVDLLPLDADPGAGSRISMAAMRRLGAELTALPELRIYRAD